ncbi:MAG: ABC transporter permease [Anaerolineales bacterium]
MNAFWWVAAYEYTRNVLRRGFLIALLSVPIWILVTMLIVIVMVSVENNTTPIGYVDHSGVLVRAIPAPPDENSGYDPVPLRPFADEAAARQALDAREIAGYYVLPANYLEGGAVDIVYRERIRDAAESQFENFVRVNLAADLPPEIVRRVLEGTNWEVVTLDEESTAALEDTLVRTLVPFVSGMIMYMGLFIVSGYLMHAMIEEKENRTIEILVTSISPDQLMVGKIIGILGVGLTQIVVWTGMGLIAFLFFRARLPDIPALDVDWRLMGKILLVLGPSFVMVCGLMAAIGATLTSTSDGQQITGLVTLPLMLPMMLLGLLIKTPNSPLAIGLGLFPLTAPMTMIMRLSFGEVSGLQFGISIGMLMLFAAGSLWLAGRVLRLGMLQYGHRIRLGEIWQDMLGQES